jgi:hypothetical protein
MKRLAPCVVILTLVACGGGNSSTPTTPSAPTPTPQSNRAPVINSMTVSPNFGIVNLTTFNYGAAASDPDGDSVTYNWNIAGNGSSSASGALVFSNGASGTASLTVSDGKGGTATDTRPFVVGTMAGTWTGTLIGFPFIMNLAQPAGGVITGTWSQPGTGYSGQLDPAAINRIDGNAAVTMRIKVTVGGPRGGFNDFTFTGTMEPSGTRLTGSLNGSGFNNEPFSLTKQ